MPAVQGQRPSLLCETFCGPFIQWLLGAQLQLRFQQQSGTGGIAIDMKFDDDVRKRSGGKL